MGKNRLDEYTLVVVGSGGVGKSCLTVRFLKDEFMSEYDPTIEENYRKKATLPDYECMLDIVDTAGQQEYTSLRDQHLRAGQGFLICFAVNDSGSFNEAKGLHQAIIRAKDAGDKIAFAVAATKIDLKGQRVVSAEDGKAFADSIQSPFIETSAKEKIGVDEAFMQLVKEIRRVGATPRNGKKSKSSGSSCLIL